LRGWMPVWIVLPHESQVFVFFTFINIIKARVGIAGKRKTTRIVNEWNDRQIRIENQIKKISPNTIPKQTDKNFFSFAFWLNWKNRKQIIP
jgi:hypothetical protein